MKEKIFKFYYLNMISFKCFPILFKHKRILSTVFSMTFCKLSGDILLISSMMFFNYRQMIPEYFVPQLEDLDMQNLWFYQNGATPHTARETMTILRAAFPGRVIYRFGDVPWPPRSPDFTPSDFFLWRYLKGKVYINMPNTLHELNNNIIEEVNRITPDSLQKIMENTVLRIRLCLNNNGEHLKHIIFK